MKKINYNCDCDNTFELILIEKGDRVLQDKNGKREEIIVDNPYEYPPYPEACPECDFCPSDDFIEKVLNNDN